MNQRRGPAAFPGGAAYPVWIPLVKEALLIRAQKALALFDVSWQECARIVVAAAALCCCLKWSKSYTAVEVLGAAATCFAGYPLLKSALASASRRRLTADFALALAVVAALCIGESSIALTVILFILLARTIAEKAIAHGRKVLYQVAERRPIALAAGKAFDVPAPIQRTADWFFRFLVGLSLGAALFTLLIAKDVRSAIAVIVVAGGCGLTSGTFVVILGAMARAAKRGVLIMAPVSLEELANVDVAVLDEAAVPAFRAVETPCLSPDDKSHARARHAVGRLSKMNIETILFTGELNPAAEVIGNKLGVNFVEAELFPEDKCCKIAALRGKGRRVVMLSGINADPALVEADVGVVIGSAAAMAEAPADVILASDNLCDFVEVIALARRAKRIVNFNLSVTALLTSVGIGLAMGGLLNPVSALAMRFTLDLAVILNATRFVPVNLRMDAASPSPKGLSSAQVT